MILIPSHFFFTVERSDVSYMINILIRHKTYFSGFYVFYQVVCYLPLFLVIIQLTMFFF